LHPSVPSELNGPSLGHTFVNARVVCHDAPLSLKGPVAIIPPMETPANDFGRALDIDAEAVGQPGRRRFRVLVRSAGQTASVWMEKQQLAGIGDWFEEVVQRLDNEQPGTEPSEEPGPIAAIYDLEFTAGQIGLGYLEDQHLFALQCFDLAGGTQQPTFRCLVS